MLRTRRLVKEIYQVINTVESFTNGQAKISQLDSDDVRTIHITIQPTDGLYEGGTFEFKVSYCFCRRPVRCLVTEENM